ncbi:MAG TPA: S53 family peptidase [Ktedonobacterales bacterium]
MTLTVTVTVLAACSFSVGSGPSVVTSTPNAQGTETAPDIPYGTAYTPQQIRDAYGITPLYDKGYRGQGQTVVIIDSYGDPTLQQDLATFDTQFGLPAANVRQLAPLGTVPYNPANKEMVLWQLETTMDVEIVHAIAPDASIVVLTSPVDETEGVAGLPQFLQLEQYALNNHLGYVVSESWAASEVSLNDAAGLTEIARWDAFFQQATTQGHMTFFGSSGDNGASDYVDTSLTTYSSTPTTSFPGDNPWVTSVGGTTLTSAGGAYQEVVWNSNGGASGGGFSKFYSTPTFQRSLPAGAQSRLSGRRGVPDVAAAADPSTGLAIYSVDPQDPSGAHTWSLAGGTSAGSPFWAGMMAIANQVAGRPLGYINPSLYKIAASSSYSSAFRDVTSGDNTFTHGSLTVQGYQAGNGWDAATGLGTPNAVNLIPLLIKDIPA